MKLWIREIFVFYIVMVTILCFFHNTTTKWKKTLKIHKETTPNTSNKNFPKLHINVKMFFTSYTPITWSKQR